MYITYCLIGILLLFTGNFIRIIIKRNTYAAKSKQIKIRVENDKQK